MTTSKFIRPEIVAAKLAAWRELDTPNFALAAIKEPRLPELAWYIQALSMRPGSTRPAVEDFLKEFSDRIGTQSMHRIGKTDEPYTAAERSAIFKEVPCGELETTWVHINKLPPADRATAPAREGGCFETLGDYQESFYDRVPSREFLARQNHSYFHAYCHRIALSELPWMLEKFATEPDAVIESPWWFHDLQGALMDAMEASAARAAENIAMTQVTREIFRTLQFAADEKAMVKIIGESRFGKTESVKAWCNGNPGKARLVKTPPTTDERSFLEAIADALGAARGLEVTTAKLRATLEYILRHCGLMFVFDESAWLIPSRYTNKTTPARLNYIRSQMLEHGCPVALIETPQFTAGAAHRFEKTTGFNMTQWNGRIMRTVNLPSELPEQDLFAVVNIHFPTLARSCVKQIVTVALMSDSFLFAVEKVAKNARSVARENGREEISESDIAAGITLAGFTTPRVPAAKSEPAPARTPAPRRTRELTPSIAAPARSTTPALQPV